MSASKESFYHDFVWNPPKDDFIWTPPGSSISTRWQRKGWIPPSEQLEYQIKWKYYRSLPNRRFEDEGVIELEKYELTREAVLEEREACANKCEELYADSSGPKGIAAEKCAEAIRDR